MGVATAVAIGGLAIGAASTTMSFVQAGQQKKKQREAEAKASEAMAEARRKLEVNFAENRSIKKEPYELAREAMLSTGAQSIQAGVESDRGAEATAGKVQMAMNQGQGDIRSSMGAELTDIEKDIVNENSRLRDLGVQLDLGEAEGAQLAARDAEEASVRSMNEGFQGLTSTLGAASEMIPLYQKSASAKQFGKMQKASGLDQANFQNAVSSMSDLKGFEGLSSVGSLDKNSFNAVMSQYTPDQIKYLNQEFLKRKQAMDKVSNSLSGFNF